MPFKFDGAGHWDVPTWTAIDDFGIGGIADFLGDDNGLLAQSGSSLNKLEYVGGDLIATVNGTTLTLVGITQGRALPYSITRDAFDALVIRVGDDILRMEGSTGDFIVDIIGNNSAGTLPFNNTMYEKMHIGIGAFGGNERTKDDRSYNFDLPAGTANLPDQHAGASHAVANGFTTGDYELPNLDIIGQGTLQAAPSPYYSHDRVDGTGIAIDDLKFLVDPTSKAVPFSVRATVLSRVSGARRNSNMYPNAYEHAEHRWTLTKGDDSPIGYWDEIIDHNTGNVANPATDTISPEFTCVVREPGDYKLTCVARIMTSTGQVRVATRTETFTLVNSSLNHRWYDPAGSDANDGLDPNGFSLTAGSYVESSGQLTQVGAFASYVHNATDNPQATGNYIHIVGSGLHKIASKLSNDTIVLADKLGSDQAGLTSSNGPVATFSGASIDGTAQHLKGGNTYNITTEWKIDRKSAGVELHGYNGRPTITSTTITGYLVALDAQGASSFAPAKVVISGFIADGNSTVLRPIRSIMITKGSTLTTDVLIDRCDVVAPAGDVGLEIQVNLASTKAHITHWGGLIDNLRRAAEPKRFATFTLIPMGCTLREVGTIYDTDCDNQLLDHFKYPNGDHENYHVAWIYCRNGSGASYCLNNNNSQLGVSKRKQSFHNCKLADGNANYAIDLSAGKNYEFTKCHSDVYIARNYAKVANDFMSPFLGESFALYDNRVVTSFGTTSNGYLLRIFMEPGIPINNYDYVLQRNYNYGQGLVIDLSGMGSEVTDNIVQVVQKAKGAVRLAPSEVLDHPIYFDNNTFIDDVVGDIEYWLEEVPVTLPVMIAASGNGAFLTDSVIWTDPANLDFSLLIQILLGSLDCLLHVGDANNPTVLNGSVTVSVENAAGDTIIVAPASATSDGTNPVVVTDNAITAGTSYLFCVIGTPAGKKRCTIRTAT